MPCIRLAIIFAFSFAFNLYSFLFPLSTFHFPLSTFHCLYANCMLQAAKPFVKNGHKNVCPFLVFVLTFFLSTYNCLLSQSLDCLETDENSSKTEKYIHKHICNCKLDSGILNQLNCFKRKCGKSRKSSKKSRNN